MVGLFDSGLGGLTVLRRVRERLPDVDVLYFADQANVPYGGRAPDDLFALLQNNLAWLDERGVEAVVMACNTSCAIADTHGWPATSAEVFDLLDSATIALQHSRAQRIGVVATEATVRSGAYGRRIRNAILDGEVWEVPAPELVPLVEAGLHDSAVARDAVRRRARRGVRQPRHLRLRPRGAVVREGSRMGAPAAAAGRCPSHRRRRRRRLRFAMSEP